MGTGCSLGLSGTECGQLMRCFLDVDSAAICSDCGESVIVKA